MQWAPGVLCTYQDGVLDATVTRNMPTTPMHPVLQNEFSNTLEDPEKPPPRLHGHVYVDRVTYDRDYTGDPADRLRQCARLPSGERRARSSGAG